jgi:PAS domain S-box-containing protein
VRYAQRGAAFTTFLVAAVAICGTVLGSGPFARGALHESLLQLQVFVALTAATVLTLGAAVAERDRAQHEAREAMARKGAVFDAALDSLVTIDHHGRIQEFNPAAERTFGRRRDEALGRPMADLLFPLDLGEAHGSILGKRLELTAIRSDGTEFPVEVAIVRVPREGPPIFTGFIRDLTEQKRAAAEFQWSYSLLRAVIEGTTDAVFVKNLEGRYLLINDAGARRAGRPVSEILGKDDSALFPGDTAREITETDHKIITAGETLTIEEVVSVDGKDLTFLSMKGPYRDGAGKVSGLIGIARDITDRKRLEGELRHAVTGRDEFLSIASHELRTPITTLALQLDALRRLVDREFPDGGTEKMIRRIEMAVRQTNRLTALVNGLLNVSRISLGRFRLDLEDFDLSNLVREVAEGFSDEAARAGYSVSLRIVPVLIGRWDRSRIEQALTNLLSNSIKYGAGKPIEIDLTAEGSGVELAVRDQGIGIASEELTRIFGRFERAVPSKHYGGLGLGLYVAREIVEAHGGSIVAVSRPGEGATFTIRLPRTTAVVESTAIERPL